MSPRDLQLELTSDPSELARVRELLGDWCQADGWDEQRRADIVLALDEALTNVIRHGYEGRPGQRIDVTVQHVRDAVRGEGLEITVRDYGRQVPIQSICGRDLRDLQPGGLGVHIIHGVMDSAEYTHAPGGGMRLVMRKYRGGAAGRPARPEPE